MPLQAVSLRGPGFGGGKLRERHSGRQSCPPPIGALRAAPAVALPGLAHAALQRDPPAPFAAILRELQQLEQDGPDGQLAGVEPADRVASVGRRVPGVTVELGIPQQRQLVGGRLEPAPFPLGNRYRMDTDQAGQPTCVALSECRILVTSGSSGAGYIDRSLAMTHPSRSWAVSLH